MKLISHRGNLGGPNPKMENKPDYILNALKLGYDVEIDIWMINDNWYLGHDTPTYKIDFRWIRDRISKLWIHCKDFKSLDTFNEIGYNINYFWHQNDDFTLTSNGYIWTYPGKQLGKNSISVLPERNGIVLEDIEHCYGVCSDYIKKYKDI